MAVRRLSATDVPVYREIRLRALRTDPDAFGSSYEREVEFDHDTWVARMTDAGGRPAAIIVDEDASGRAVGVVGVRVVEDRTTTAITAMWVAPEARRTGSGRRLLTAATEWAIEHDCTTATLAVVWTNAPAIALYRSFGFVDAAPSAEVDGDPPASELALQLALPRRLHPAERPSS